MQTNEIRERLDAYVRENYGIVPEILPFSKEKYEIFRHSDTGKWFAVFVEKEQSVFGFDGDGTAEILCVKPRDPYLADFLLSQPGYLGGYPSKSWKWLSVVLDGTVPFEEICNLLDESYRATKAKGKNLKTPLSKKE